MQTELCKWLSRQVEQDLACETQAQDSRIGYARIKLSTEHIEHLNNLSRKERDLSGPQFSALYQQQEQEHLNALQAIDKMYEVIQREIEQLDLSLVGMIYPTANSVCDPRD